MGEEEEEEVARRSGTDAPRNEGEKRDQNGLTRGGGYSRVGRMQAWGLEWQKEKRGEGGSCEPRMGIGTREWEKGVVA